MDSSAIQKMVYSHSGRGKYILALFRYTRANGSGQISTYARMIRLRATSPVPSLQILLSRTLSLSQLLIAGTRGRLPRSHWKQAGPDGMFVIRFSNSLSQSSVNAETFRGFTEALISCPQKRGRIDKDGGYQVGVGEADA